MDLVERLAGLWEERLNRPWNKKLYADFYDGGRKWMKEDAVSLDRDFGRLLFSFVIEEESKYGLNALI